MKHGQHSERMTRKAGAWDVELVYQDHFRCDLGLAREPITTLMCNQLHLVG